MADDWRTAVVESSRPSDHFGSTRSDAGSRGSGTGKGRGVLAVWWPWVVLGRASVALGGLVSGQTGVGGLDLG